MELQDRVVIVTGASSGIGAATARAFGRAGAKVVLAARSAPELNALAQELGQERALVAPTDVVDRGQVDALVWRALERFGRIDILVNNAGVGLLGATATLNTDNFQRILAVNLLGPLYAIQAVVPHLRKPGGGLIINVSSMVSRLTIPQIGGYRATKLALNALSDNARVELKRDNIRVITVYPGVTDTAFFAKTLDSDGSDAGDWFRPQPPECVAQKIVEGARKEPREVFMSRAYRVSAFIGLALPRVFERVIARRGRR